MYDKARKDEHPGFEIGKDVTKYMSDIFECYHKVQNGKGEVFVGLDRLDEQGKPWWTNHLIPSYHISVDLVGSIENPYSNHHSFSFDFKLVS